MSGINFRHFQTEKHGAITVAYCFGDHNIQGDGKLFKMGVAFCSPREKHFDKKRGRLVAEGRLTTYRNGYTELALQPGVAAPLGFLIHYMLPRVEGPSWFGEFLSHMWNADLLRQHAMRCAVHLAFRDVENIENTDVVAIRFKYMEKRWLVYCQDALTPSVEEDQNGSWIVTKKAKSIASELGEALAQLKLAYPFKSVD